MTPADEQPVIFADAVRSLNYDPPDGAEVFADAGTLIDLTSGDIITPGLVLDGTTGDLTLRGDITADGFQIADGSGAALVASAAAGVYSIGAAGTEGGAQGAAVLRFTYATDEIAMRTFDVTDGTGNVSALPGTVTIEADTLIDLTGPTSITGQTEIGAAANEVLTLASTLDRPYLAVYGGTDGARKGYFGFPDTSTDELNINADDGNLTLRVGGTAELTLTGSACNIPSVYSTTSAATTQLVRVAGTGGQLQRSTSRRDHKRDVRRIEDTDPLIDAVLGMPVYEYGSRLPADPPGWRGCGWMADEVLPMFAARDAEDPEGEPMDVDRLGIVPVLAAAVRRNARQIAELRRIIDKGAPRPTPTPTGRQQAR